MLTATRQAPSNQKRHKSMPAMKSLSGRLWPHLAAYSSDTIRGKSLCACGGTCPKCRAEQSIQPKLKIGAPDDEYEREADRVADQVMHPKSTSFGARMPETAVQRQEGPEEEEGGDGLIQSKSLNESASLPLQREVAPDNLDEEDEKQEEPALQAMALPGLDAKTSGRIQSLKGGGRSLPQQSRAFFESRLGHDFSGVRIHTGATAVEAAQAVNARAFTLGNDVVFNRGEYLPATDSGKRLLAHELTHVIQQGQSMQSSTVRREPTYPWDEAQKRRELRPGAVPSGLNYELQDHKLIAHTTSSGDIGQIVDFMEVLGLYTGVLVDRAALAKALAAARDKKPDGARVDIDVTSHLPKAIRDFLISMENFYSAWRKHVAKHGGVVLEDIFEKFPSGTPEQKKAVEDWYEGSPAYPDEFGAACHQFAMLALGGAAKGLSGGGETDVKNIKNTDARHKLFTSLQGRGPFRRVRDRSEVRVGDIAVFRGRDKQSAGIEGHIVHSAIVMRVSGNGIELFEKTNPHDPMATRTVSGVLSDYSSSKAYVSFLTPALAGMPAQSRSGLGNAPPSAKYKSEPGTVGREDTHVLFRIDTNVLLAHEDLKLFRLLAAHRKRVSMTVHGYASEDGAITYNLNLSAHRAVTVKQALTAQLPGGSDVKAVAHGETSAFGNDYRENRRAGIEVETTAPAAVPSNDASPGGAEKEAGPIQKKSNEESTISTLQRGARGVASNIQSLQGGGKPLPQQTRTFFESRMGHDFSGVRIHTDATAVEAAQSVNARAFTLGNDVVFNRGEYAPQSDGGKRLLAHELAHVVQQGYGGDPAFLRRSITVMSPKAPAPNPPKGTVMTNAQLVDSWMDRMCPAGNWGVNSDSGAVSSPNRDSFCSDSPGAGSAHWRSSGTPTSCRCLCEATAPDAADIRVRTEDKFTVGDITVDVVGSGEGARLGPDPKAGRPETYVGVTGRSFEQPGVGETGAAAGAGKVSQEAWLIFVHEVCGHTVLGRGSSHIMTPSGGETAVDIENRVRREHSTIDASLGIRKGEFRADEDKSGMMSIVYEGSLYIARNGETLLSIARRCGIPRSAIPGKIFSGEGDWIADSEIDSIHLKAGDPLRIAGVFWHEVIKDEIVGRIARLWGVPTQSVCRANVGYRVRNLQHHGPNSRLMDNCDRIYPGDLLLIPSS